MDLYFSANVANFVLFTKLLHELNSLYAEIIYMFSSAKVKVDKCASKPKAVPAA